MTTEHPLIAARNQAGITRDGLAEMVSTSRVTIWRIESKQAVPSLELVARIIAALRAKGVNLSADAFLPSTAPKAERVA